jgi:hypothetical protein
MTQNSIRTIVPFDAKDDAIRGILLSYFSSSRDILLKERKASYFFHFCFERLNKNERKWLLINLENFIKQLEVTKLKTNEDNSIAQTELKIPTELEKLISLFKNI